jgi:hypothetical protein
MEIITNYIILLIPYLGIEENKAKLKTTLISLQAGNTDIEITTSLTGLQKTVITEIITAMTDPITDTDIISLTKMQKRGNPQKWIRPR